MSEMAKTLIGVGMVLIAVGAGLYFFGKAGWVGRLPGDFQFRRDGFSFYFPLASCLAASVVLTLLVNLFSKR